MSKMTTLYHKWQVSMLLVEKLIQKYKIHTKKEIHTNLFHITFLSCYFFSFFEDTQQFNFNNNNWIRSQEYTAQRFFFHCVQLCFVVFAAGLFCVYFSLSSEDMRKHGRKSFFIYMHPAISLFSQTHTHVRNNSSNMNSHKI